MSTQNIISYYCKSRETQAFYTRCLDLEGLSENERELIFELIEYASLLSRIIKQSCSINEEKEK